MKNLKKISRGQLKEIVGGAKGPVIQQACQNICCPPPGIVRCPELCCLVACPGPDLTS